MCACTQTRTLSDEAALEIHEFLEVIAANFLSRYASGSIDITPSEPSTSSIMKNHGTTPMPVSRSDQR
jgi:hypothetical protein